MENASKALIIAGAILLSILIIAIGMYIYSSAQAQVENSITNMSTSEIEGFNSTFTAYSGKQTGSQVKTLITRLIANAKTYEEELTKIPKVHYQAGATQGAAGKIDTTTEDIAVKLEGKTAAYVNALNGISKKLDLKHQYRVVTDTGVSGLIEHISINYDVTDDNGYFEAADAE